MFHRVNVQMLLFHMMSDNHQVQSQMMMYDLIFQLSNYHMVHVHVLLLFLVLMYVGDCTDQMMMNLMHLYNCNYTAPVLNVHQPLDNHVQRSAGVSIYQTIFFFFSSYSPFFYLFSFKPHLDTILILINDKIIFLSSLPGLRVIVFFF